MRDQEIRQKTSAKISSTSEVMERIEANTLINGIKGYKMMMFTASST